MSKGTRHPKPTDLPKISVCIFCGRLPLTHEHLVPKWISKLLPDHQLIHHQNHNYSSWTNRENQIFSPKHDFIERTLKIVCRQCNNKWMSDLQEKARPVLTPLILGQESELDENSVHLIRAWMVAFTMVSEYVDPYHELVTVSQDERRAFMQDQKVMPHWSVWLGRTKLSRSRLRMHTAASTELVYTDDKSRQAIHLCPNIQTTTLAIGHLFLHSFSSTSEYTYEISNSNAIKLVGQKDLRVSGESCLSRASIDEIAFKLSRMSTS